MSTSAQQQEQVFKMNPPWKVHEEPEFSFQGERVGCELFI